jgi:hypothetical protein
MLCTPTFDESYTSAELVAQHGHADERPTAAAVTLRTILEALREGLTAHRRYEHLRSEGILHDPAIRQVFCIPQPPTASEARSRCLSGS